MELNALDSSRLQFAFAVSFHINWHCCIKAVVAWGMTFTRNARGHALDVAKDGPTLFSALSSCR